MKQTCKFLVVRKRVEDAKIDEQIDNRSKCSNVEKNLRVRKCLEKKEEAVNSKDQERNRRRTINEFSFVFSNLCSNRA